MAKALEIIGHVPCVCCGERTPVKQMSNAYVMVNCQWCGAKLQALAKRADVAIRKKMTPSLTEETPNPAPKMPIQEDQEPAPKKSGWLS